MKTTLEIPDNLFRQAKSAAAGRGIPLREFVTEAVKDTLVADAKTTEKSWMTAFGKLRHLAQGDFPNQPDHRAGVRGHRDRGSVVILDTNGLSAQVEGDPAIEPLLRKAAQIALPVIVLGEY
jgi:hypothetical protein